MCCQNIIIRQVTITKRIPLQREYSLVKTLILVQNTNFTIIVHFVFTKFGFNNLTLSNNACLWKWTVSETYDVSDRIYSDERDASVGGFTLELRAQTSRMIKPKILWQRAESEENYTMRTAGKWQCYQTYNLFVNSYNFN